MASFGPVLLNSSQGHQHGTAAQSPDRGTVDNLNENSEQDVIGSEAETDYSSWDGFPTDEETGIGDNGMTGMIQKGV
jgi:hypothetical protein